MKSDHDGDEYPGSMKSRAKKVGQSASKFAEANIHADGPVGKLARLHYIRGHAMVHGSGNRPT